MNKRIGITARFAGFYCRKCGGRVFEDDPYVDGNNRRVAVLTCLLCAQTHQCYEKDYRKLLGAIEGAIRKKKTKTRKV